MMLRGDDALRKGLTVSALVAIAAVAWAFLVRDEAAMRSMSGDGPTAELMRIMMQPSEARRYFLAAAFTWVVMMIGMMTPAIVPMKSRGTTWSTDGSGAGRLGRTS